MCTVDGWVTQMNVTEFFFLGGDIVLVSPLHNLGDLTPWFSREWRQWTRHRIDGKWPSPTHIIDLTHFQLCNCTGLVLWLVCRKRVNFGHVNGGLLNADICTVQLRISVRLIYILWRLLLYFVESARYARAGNGSRGVTHDPSQLLLHTSTHTIKSSHADVFMTRT